MSHHSLLIKGAPIDIVATLKLWSDDRNLSEKSLFDVFFDLNMNDKLKCLYDGSIRLIVVNREYQREKLSDCAVYISVGHMELGRSGTILPLEQKRYIKEFMTITKKQRMSFNKKMKKVEDKIKLCGRYGIYHDIFEGKRQYQVYYFNQTVVPNKK